MVNNIFEILFFSVISNNLFMFVLQMLVTFFKI